MLLAIWDVIMDWDFVFMNMDWDFVFMNNVRLV
jgi:hypothetical protein